MSSLGEYAGLQTVAGLANVCSATAASFILESYYAHHSRLLRDAALRRE